MNACGEPEGNGTGDCTDTVEDMNNCGIGYSFTGTDYMVPAMDTMAVCDLMDNDWACIQACMDAHCPDDTDAAWECIGACD